MIKTNDTSSVRIERAENGWIIHMVVSLSATGSKTFTETTLTELLKSKGVLDTALSIDSLARNK